MSVLLKFSNPSQLSEAELDKALERVQGWVEQMGAESEGPALVTEGEENLSPAEILRILKKRRQNDDWGHDDILESYLLLMAKTADSKPSLK